MSRIFAIGDIHGHFNELSLLLYKIKVEANFNMEVDHLVLLGDLVDNGDNTNGVLRFCIKQKERYPNNFHPLRGNHEDILLDVVRQGGKYTDDTWLTQGGIQTLKSYKSDGEHDYRNTIPEKHLNFLDSLPYYWETDEYFFVHGGVPPRLLKNIDFTDPKVLDELLWIRDEFITSNQKWEKKIIFAHTPKVEVMGPGYSKFVPIIMDNKIGINTMPRNEGYLTCVQLPEEKFYYQNKR